MNDYGYNSNNDNPQGFSYTNGNYYPPQPSGDYNGAGSGQNQSPKKKRGGFFAAVAGIAAASAFAGSLITGYAVLPQLVKQQISASLPQQIQAAEQNTPLEAAASSNEESVVAVGNTSNPVPEIAERVKDSVVSIIMYNKTFTSGQQPVEEKLSWGTGFVISDDGLILTNAHVVNDGNLIKVKTNAGDEYVAELVGKDNETELAVIKVENIGLPPVTIGNSDELRTGDFVIAIGNPVNLDRLQNTVTVGYVSSESREIALHNTPVKMIQTDAAINPGNSGGPLLNDKGEVIGINTMKTLYVQGDTYGSTLPTEGIGFAIPITDAMKLADQLIANGSIVKPGIGFMYAPVSQEDATLWESPRGIIIRDIVSGSPAQEAGLKVYDIITSIDGVDLTNGADVPSFGDRNVGDEIPAVVWRDGKEYQVTFTLKDLNKLENSILEN